jgi:hypothetical protein
MPKSQSQQPDLIKSIVIFGLLGFVVIISSVVISVYPQHIWVSNSTVIDSIVGNFHNGTVNIKGNQVQYSTGDSIMLNGKDYIRLTGNQVQIGGNTYENAIRTISASIDQNVLFQQKLGTFTNSATVTIDNTIINMNIVNATILNVQTADSNYNIEFMNSVVYITSGNVMLKLINSYPLIDVYLIGTGSHNKITFERS